MDRAALEAELAQFPLCACAFFDTDALVFSERVRRVCETDCAMYGKSWSCPPAVGSVDECRARALSYKSGLLIATAAEAGDDISGRAAHERITDAVVELMRQYAGNVLALSAEACAKCGRCAWPAPCRHPECARPCVESYGILLTDLAERCGADFTADGYTIWFSLILYND